MTEQTRISDIEVLRAVAVLAVIYQHLRNLFPWKIPGLNELYSYGGGMFGVDLFFAVSGFVIARDLIPRMLAAPDRQTQWRTALSFWTRRCWRLLPAAWFWLLVVLLAASSFNLSGAFGSLAANLDATVAGALNFANVRFAQTFMRSEYGASFVYWSLSLEEQFYLIFPLLILALRKKLVWLLLVVALLQIATPRQHPYLMMFRTDALALGILLAIWSQQPSWYRLRQFFASIGRRTSQIIVLLSIAIMALLSTPQPPTVYNVGLIAILAAVIVCIAAQNQNLLLEHGRPKRMMTWIGERSYALYLIYVPAFFATRELFHRAGLDAAPTHLLLLAYLLAALALLLIATELNFRWLESPLRRYGAKQANAIMARSTPVAPASPQIPRRTRHAGSIEKTAE